MNSIELQVGEYALSGGGTLKVIKTGGAGSSKLVFAPNGGAVTEMKFNENGFIVKDPEPTAATATVRATFIAPEVKADEDEDTGSGWRKRK